MPAARTDSLSVPAGSLYADAPAAAETAGAAGNAAAGTVTVLVSPPVGVGGCTNPAAFAGGTDGEDDETFRTRVLASFVSLPNGANRVFYEQRALSHAGVAAAQVIPRIDGIGTVGVVVASHAGIPEEALLDEVAADLESAREIAVDVSVLAPTAEPVAVTAAIRPAAGVSFAAAKAAVEAALTGYFTGARLGQPVYRAVLGNLIYQTGLVENYALSAPAADIAAAQQKLPTLGTLTITEAG